MEVQFTPEQEAQLSQIANYDGTPAEQLVKQAALRPVKEEAEIRAGIREGIEQADRGELIDHEEVKARIFRRLPLRHERPLDGASSRMSRSYQRLYCGR